jgi:hypothetical protein
MERVLLGGHGFDFLKRLYATCRCRRLVRQEASSNSTLTRLRRTANPFYLSLARLYCFLQILHRKLHVVSGFFHLEGAFRGYLVLMCLHAINHPPFAPRHVAAIFSNVASAGALQLFSSGSQFLLDSLCDIRLSGRRAGRQDRQQGQKSKANRETHGAYH